MRPLILDLFCGAGLVYDGLYEVGLQPVGVDYVDQPDYPGPFLRADVRDLDDRFLDLFPLIWASPPCLKDTVMHASARREQVAHGRPETAHPDLITPTQRMLDRWAERTGGDFTIENVANCKVLRDPFILCGSMFDLGIEDAGVWHRLERHRKFETNWPAVIPEHKHTDDPVVGVYGGHARRRAASAGGRGTKDVWERGHIWTMHDAMGLNRRLPGKSIDQGIPPAYACHLGHQMLARHRERIAA